jgi:hypothetical protein
MWFDKNVINTLPISSFGFFNFFSQTQSLSFSNGYLKEEVVTVIIIKKKAITTQ